METMGKEFYSVEPLCPWGPSWTGLGEPTLNELDPWLKLILLPQAQSTNPGRAGPTRMSPPGAAAAVSSLCSLRQATLSR